MLQPTDLKTSLLRKRSSPTICTKYSSQLGISYTPQYIVCVEIWHRRLTVSALIWLNGLPTDALGRKIWLCSSFADSCTSWSKNISRTLSGPLFFWTFHSVSALVLPTRNVASSIFHLSHRVSHLQNSPSSPDFCLARRYSPLSLFSALLELFFTVVKRPQNGSRTF